MTQDIEQVPVPANRAEQIERLEQAFRLLEQQMLVAQLNIANAKANFRIVELETLADLGLDPNVFYIDRVDGQLLAKRRDTGGNT